MIIDDIEIYRILMYINVLYNIIKNYSNDK
jgi:hypothetical protein